jgi:hypothetical protein
MEEVYTHLHMENNIKGRNGLKIKKMEEDFLTNTLIMVKQKVFIESIIVTPKNAMLVVLSIKLLHLGG